MNNNETTNPTLTFDQLQAIDEAKKRLSNIENEVTLATKNLKVLKLDTERITKENLYQNELLANVTVQVEEKKLQSTKLDESLLETNDKLASLNSEIATKSLEHLTKIQEFRATEDRLATQEFDVSAKEQKLLKVAFDLETGKKEFDAKVIKLKEVIKDF